jgi:hypothetical protein
MRPARAPLHMCHMCRPIGASAQASPGAVLGRLAAGGGWPG